MTCITAWVEWKVELRRASVVLLALLLANSPCISKVLYEKDSMYHHIIVEQRGTMRILRFDNTWQSAIDLSDPNKTIFPYTDYIHLALIFNPQIKSVLFVGLGGGTAPMRFHRDYPDMTVHVVEIDPEVKRVAMRYFGFKEDQRMKVFIQDGRMFLRRTRTIYDLIVMDAYHATKYGLSIPFHLTTKEFYQLAWRRLSARGVLAYNLIGRLEGGRTRTTRAFVKTIQSVFPLVYIFPVDYRRDPWVTDRRNIILIATKNRKRISPADIVARARLLVRKRVKIPRYAEYAADIYVKPLNLRNVPLFTDDYAPVEYLEP
ncbi:MAG TPA: hypothetical protein EYP10_03945 [Armatimonadetes bacterium]|nr:hypothetical protein [Armatimonadota bacterium]